YSYDQNGNLRTDSRKGLNFEYNHLNLSKKVTKGSTGESISYLYDATGRKLRKETAGGNRDYIGGIEYGNNGNIEFVQTEEGRAVNTGGTYSYEYMLKDHLGNTRAVVKQDGSILQTPDYYAFGMELNRNRLTPSPDNRYKYNGKELQTGLAIGQYDYGARFYDAVIGRWDVADPLAEKYHIISPYAYVANNPAIAYDVDGRKIIYVNGFFSRLLNLGGFAPGAAKEEYWNFFSPTFITSSRQFMGATNSELNEFIDGSSYVGIDQDAGDRYERGMQYAMENYDDLIKGMKKGETFKFVSHSEGGGFAAGMAAYLISKGQTVENMLYLSPDEVDDKFSSPIETFSIQSHFQGDGISPSKRLEGVDVYMNFSTLNGKKPGFGGNHGATVTTANIKKIKDVMAKFGPDAKKILSNGRWTVTETKNGYTFKREKEKEDED
ncbi:RHS repeat domain-containing protein, partial [Pararcticibacter amylolyticus]